LITIVDYGIGNIASVRNAFLAAGASTVVTSNAGAVLEASGIVLPGVGAFGKGMENLAQRGLIKPIRAFTEAGRPFLGICLGLQLLFTESYEGGRFPGLDLISGTVERLNVNLKVPHVGWNQIERRQGCPEVEGIADESFFYFVHSYHVVPEDRSVVAAETEYGVRFVSAIKKENIFACQFHPERSGEVGLRLIRNFIRLVEGE